MATDPHAALIAEIEAETTHTAVWTGRGKLSPRVLAALGRVRREAFVPAGEESSAYLNQPLPIGYGQTISQPFMVAIMTELLDLTPTSVVLEIGTGSGYQAAILGEIAAQVYTVEVIPQLAARAQAALERAGYRNVHVRSGDGALGWPEHAPFDAIIVTAAAEEIPPALPRQLKPGGRMVIPVGRWPENQVLVLVEKRADGTAISRDVLPVAFVPLTRPRRAGSG